MDIERLTHRGYRMSVIVAVVLSAMVVTFAALLGRGTLNLKGALALDEPTDVTVIALVEPKLMENVKISEINFLRKEKRDGDDRPSYAYQVQTSDSNNYLVRIGFDITSATWTLTQFEYLHGSAPESGV